MDSLVKEEGAGSNPAGANRSKDMINRMCTCGKLAGHRHHQFPQHKAHREKYGSLLDCDFNIEYMCPDCHSSHAKIDSLWDEERFLKELQSYVKNLEKTRGVFR